MSAPPRVLITGCSTGIGRACAFELAARGYHVVATARDPRTLENVPAAQRLALDVTDHSSIEAAIASLSTLDALVNNAGITVWGPVELLPIEQIRRVFETNVLGMVRVCQAVLPMMREQRQGTIVNVSTAALRGFPLLGAYAASKAALEAFTEALRLEAATFGIRVLLAEPAGVESDFARNRTVVEVAESAYVDLQQRALASLAAMRRAAMSSEDVACAIADLIDGDERTLRNPIGVDATRIVGERVSVADDEYERRVLQGLDPSVSIKDTV